MLGLRNLSEDIQGISKREKLSSLKKIDGVRLHGHGVVVLFVDALGLGDVELVPPNSVGRPLHQPRGIELD